MNRRIRRVTIISFFIGSALIFAASYFELFFPAKNAFYLGILGDTLLAGIKSLGLAVITSTLVNILKNWLEPTETLVKNGFIERLAKCEMKELKSKIESNYISETITTIKTTSTIFLNRNCHHCYASVITRYTKQR